jgi:hypothetical protein
MMSTLIDNFNLDDSKMYSYFDQFRLYISGFAKNHAYKPMIRFLNMLMILFILKGFPSACIYPIYIFLFLFFSIPFYIPIYIFNKL